MKATFLNSTLSLAFILCVVAVIALMFLGMEVNDKLLSVVTAVVGAYIGSRLPKSETPTVETLPTETLE